ncbi:uncharacterized protein LOC126761025 isoform X1 [Bactrocera neohumeralis]|uniref:uncharacterized protein LOC126761025 isoform X1 n=2 Tax=Bactrocera neohumeralis TaxID=98809 RepID=UPI002165C1BD|nr:uncharacterized protein LOC126761025 isoform X1 [Bactrocera neohumeralis]
MSQMDISQVQMVRSAKGVDMLCVDNFLYHFVDRGNKRCRWVCNRLKSKYQPCRSRIATVIVEGDESQHKVVRVTNEHTHERCSEKEISKVVERKLRADLAGKPCTLKSKRIKQREHLSDEDSNSNRQRWVGGSESDEWPADDDDIFPKEINKNKVVETYSDKSIIGKSQGKFFNFEKQKLYMLKTALGRQMISVDGFLYRLESKSITSSTHRWECIRQNPPCKTRILTECLTNDTHRLKEHQIVYHSHDGYTLSKLTKLLLKNNISVLTENGDENKAFKRIKESEIAENYALASGTSSSKPPKKRIIENLNAKIKNASTETPSNSQGKIKRFRTKAQPVTYTYSEDPLAALSTSTKYDLDKAKFTFLPSAKGHKVLCLDNYIYHLDTRSPRNGRAYWTCLLRRDKFYKCNARVTTEMTHKGPIIIRVSGTHLHSNHSQDIKRRLCRSFVVQNAEKAGLKTENILNESGNGLNKEFKEIVERSKETIERRIGHLSKQVSDAEQEKTAKSSTTMDLCENTVSSFSSVLDSDDDHLDSSSVLPTNLEEMRENPKISVVCDTDAMPNDSEDLQKREIVYNVTYQDLVEEMTAGDEMEVEYLDIGTYSNDDHLDISTIKNEDYLDLSTNQKDLLDTNLTIDTEMNVNNVSTLRSAKGGELLCVDGYIYHLRSTQNNRTYWSCIKSKDPELNCKSRVSTINVDNEIRVFRTTNHHTHPVIESDIKRRLYNEIKNEQYDPAKLYAAASIDALNTKYTKILGKDSSKKGLDNFDAEIEDAIGMTMKLYAVSDGPPSLAVRMVLKALNISYELINIDFIAGEHMTEEYAKLNPQKEIPVLDDDGFYLSESIAIMQYICDKYGPNNNLYPKDAAKRAIVNHRLCFNMGFYYAAISAHSMAPIFFDYQRTDMSLKKVNNALSVFEIYLRDGNTKYAAADFLTIADFGLVSATLCLEAINFDLSPYPLIQKWYETFKLENPELWKIANGGMQEIAEFEKNPPDLSHMKHPFHPTRKLKE